MVFKNRHLFLLLTCLGTFLFTPFLGKAKVYKSQPKGPFLVRTQNPIYLQFLNMPLEKSTTLEHQQIATEFSLTFSNLFEQSLQGENYIADMELWRTTLTARYGITPHLDAAIEIATLSQFGGFLDGFIEGYHDVFGFPNAGRSSRSQNTFAHSLSKDGESIFRHNQQKLGFGDTTLRFKYNLSHLLSLKTFKIATALAVKIPTGENQNGLSSGHFDFGLSFFLEKNFKRFHLHTQLGAVLLTGHSQLDNHLRWGFVQFAQSVEYQISNSLSAIIQFSGNTSGLKGFDNQILSGAVFDIALGVAGQYDLNNFWADQFYYRIAFSEDITSRGPAVDFSLRLTTGLRF